MFSLLALNDTIVLIGAVSTPTGLVLGALWGFYKSLTAKYDKDRTSDKQEVLLKVEAIHTENQTNADKRIKGLYERMDRYEVHNTEHHEAIIARQDYTNGKVRDLEESEQSQNIKLAHIEGRLGISNEKDI